MQPVKGLMYIKIKATNFKLTPALYEYALIKLGRIRRFLVKQEKTSDSELRIELSRTTKHHQKGQVYYAEANLKIAKTLLRVEVKEYDIRAALNVLHDILEQKVSKFKEKLRPQDSRGQKKARALRGK